MKAALLYVSLFSLVWAQSDLESHHKKDKQKCTGEHQITVKGRHTKHGFYIFNYVYSSLVPSNQTQIQKEDSDKNLSSPAPRFGKGNVSKKPVDNLTAQQKNEQQKHLAEMGKDGAFGDRRHPESGQNWNGHQGNPRKGGLYQHHLEVFVGKGGKETTTGETGLDGSGDMGFLNQVDNHLGLTIDSGREQGKERPDLRGTGDDRPLGETKDNKSGLTGIGKSSKDNYIKIGEKRAGGGLSQDSNSNSSLPQKSKDPQSKVYSGFFLKGQPDTIHKGPDGERGGDADLSGKAKEDPAASDIHTRLREHGNISVVLLRKTEHPRKGRNGSRSSDPGDIKIASGEGVNLKVKKGGAGEPARITPGKLNEEKASPKGHTRDYSLSGSQVEVAGVNTPRKKEGGGEVDVKERPRSRMEATSVSKTQPNNTGEIGIPGRRINPRENPVHTTTGKTGQHGVLLSGKIMDRVSGFGGTKLHPKVTDDVLVRISDSWVSDPGSIQEGRKGDSGVGIIHRKSPIGQEGLGFSSAHPRDVGSHDKINRKAPKAQDKNRLGIAFQEANQDAVKGNMESSKAPGITANLKRSHADSSKRNVEHRGPKSSGIKSALSLHHGSRDNIKWGLNVPKKDDLKSPEHSSSSYRKVTKTSQQRSTVTPGTHRGILAKKHQGHSGIWRRKSSRPERKRPLIKHGHRSDSSQSSESDEDHKKESRRSYRDYQNDNPDSYQSVESVERNLSLESNQSDDDHSQMEDQEPSSQGSSRERKSN